MTDDKNKSAVYQAIYDEAYKYLLSFKEINEGIIKRHFDEWKTTKANTLKDVMLRMLKTIPNKQGMPKSIGNVEDLKEYLEDYDPNRILKRYDGDWKKLFKYIKENHVTNGRMDISKPNNYWVIFCKGTISAASFLSQFKNLDDFNEFVNPFLVNEYTKVSLPLLLSKEVFGLGFALACDFLKEIGYVDFAKPDVHIIAIFYGIGISKSKDQYDVLKEAVRFSKLINKTPYVIDKLFWLVGSGSFYLSNIKIKTNRNQFIEMIKQKYGNMLK
jgi:hypothetical protein